jgi:uncharacterized membrane protein
VKELKFGNIFMWGYVEIWRKVACIEKRKGCWNALSNFNDYSSRLIELVIAIFIVFKCKHLIYTDFFYILILVLGTLILARGVMSYLIRKFYLVSLRSVWVRVAPYLCIQQNLK